MILVHYHTIHNLRADLHKPLKYFENEESKAEYHPDGTLLVTSPPGRYAFKATVVMKDGIIQGVELAQ